MRKYFIGFFIFFAVAGASYVFLNRDGVPEYANNISREESLELKVDNNSEGIFMNQPVEVPSIDLSQIIDEEKAVLGERIPTGEKRIYVDLTNQTLTAYEGNSIFLKTRVSTGRWGRTPTGENFNVWSYFEAATMAGGEGADYYNLSNVPYVMYFHNDEIAASRGFGIHGTYWHNNFGHPMSHGCVNMRTSDAKKLFYWAKPSPSDKDAGPTITISGEYEY